MLYLKEKDLKIRKKFFKFEKINKINKYLLTIALKNKNFNNIIKILLKIQKRSCKISKTKLNGRCLLTNRNKGVNKSYLVSRIVLRNLMQFGIVPGFKKAVW